MLLVSFCSISASEGKISLPQNYKKSFVEYLSLDRIQNPDQFIRLYANKIAMQGKDKSGALKNGAVLIAEVYAVEKNADGSVKTSMLKRRIKDKLLLLAVMEKRAEFGANPSSPIHTGNWDFAAFKPSGEKAPKNLDACRACHTPLTQTDFLFSAEHLPSAD